MTHISFITSNTVDEHMCSEEFKTLTVCTATGVIGNLRFTWGDQEFYAQCHTCGEPLTLPESDRSHVVIDLKDDRDLDKLVERMAVFVP